MSLVSCSASTVKDSWKQTIRCATLRACLCISGAGYRSCRVGTLLLTLPLIGCFGFHAYEHVRGLFLDQSGRPEGYHFAKVVDNELVIVHWVIMFMAVRQMNLLQEGADYRAALLSVGQVPDLATQAWQVPSFILSSVVACFGVQVFMTYQDSLQDGFNSFYVLERMAVLIVNAQFMCAHVSIAALVELVHKSISDFQLSLRNTEPVDPPPDLTREYLQMESALRLYSICAQRATLVVLLVVLIEVLLVAIEAWVPALEVRHPLGFFVMPSFVVLLASAAAGRRCDKMISKVRDRIDQTTDADSLRSLLELSQLMGLKKSGVYYRSVRIDMWLLFKLTSPAMSGLIKVLGRFFMQASLDATSAFQSLLAMGLASSVLACLLGWSCWEIHLRDEPQAARATLALGGGVGAALGVQMIAPVLADV